MRKTTRTRVLPILLTLMMVLALVPATATAADIQTGTPTITPNIGIDTGTVVGFAGQEWWVVGYNSTGVYSSGTDNVTLLLKSTGNPYGNTAFRTGQSSSFSSSTLYSDGYYYADNPSGITNWVDPNEYRGSTLQQKMESIAGDINTASSKEYDLINPRTLTADDDTNQKITGGDVAGQKLWALSYDEANTINSNTVRSYGNWWWLRSPGFGGSGRAARVEINGSVYDNGHRVYNDYGVRPAFNLNLSSVIFTSAASGAGEKSNATAGSTLTSATAPSGSIKFTMEDNSVAPGFTASATARSGDTYTITYANAAADANKSISAIVMRGGVMTHYGQLVHPASASGTTTVALPTGFDPATDTLKVFAEELNSDDYTDFATTPITIDTTAPTLSAEGAIRTSDTAATVKFTSNEAGQYYYAIVESGAGTPSISTSGAGTSCDTSEQTITPVLSGNSAKDIYIVVKDAVGNVSANTFKIAIPAHVPVDKSALNTALTTANNIAHGGVNTTQAWTNFVNARTAATNILNQTSPSPTQAEIDTATANLNAAITALKAYDNNFGFENGTDRYTKGSGVNLAHSAARDWSLHTGVVYVDGQRLTHGTHYTSAAGSTRTTLHASYLDTLSVGQHTLTIEFSSGIAPIVDTFEVLAATTATGNTNTGVPATGDNSNMAVLWVALICAALGILCLILWRKRQREAVGK